MKKYILNKEGFSLLEILIILSVIGILGVGIVSLSMSILDNTKMSRAKQDIEAIRKAALSFKETTRQWPGEMRHHGFQKAIVYGAGNESLFDVASPLNFGAEERYLGTFREIFIENVSPTYPRWSSDLEIGWLGPYLDGDQMDPWGNRYVIGVVGYWDRAEGGDHPVWVISSGPDGVFQTLRNAQTLSGDDIGVRLR